MKARLVEVSDHKIQYGILTVKNVSVEEVQDMICEIKNRIYDEDFDDWSIDDVFEEFPNEWEWSFEDEPDNFIEI